MTTLDRAMIFNYLKAYLICLVSLLTLYVVIDLFNNIDDFVEGKAGFTTAMRRIGVYYAYRVAQIFDRLNEAIAVLAATFTIAWVQRSNELVPLLSAGVSTQRVVRPLLVTACLMLGLGVVNQELIIARIGPNLLNPRNDPKGDGPVLVQGAYDRNDVLVEGGVAYRRFRVVKPFHVVIPANLAGSLVHLTADEARYVPPSNDPLSGGWMMTGVQEADVESLNLPFLELVDPGRYFLRTRSVDFDVLTRDKNWFVYCSTPQLWHELNRPDSTRLASMAVLFHNRMTRPLLGIVLVVLSLGVILRDQNRNVFVSAGLCVALCALFFGIQQACKNLGDSETLSPVLAAWLPLLLFGPLALSFYDAMHT
jgi:lipopolysaccharide export system permease protein